MTHQFDVDIAAEYGMLEAVILNNLYFWVMKNEANETNYHDGYYWTYNSVKAFEKLFPYASGRKIRNALKHLEGEEIIATGNYNKSAYDRTMWYTVTEKGISILQKCKMESTKKSNQSCENVEPIPDNKTTDNKTTDNIIDQSAELTATTAMVVRYLNEVCQTHYRASTDETKKLIRARLRDGYVLQDFYTVIDKKASEWIGTDFEKFLRPKTLFGTKFENYLNARNTPQSTGNAFMDAYLRGDYK